MSELPERHHFHCHGDVMPRKHFPHYHYRPFVRGERTCDRRMQGFVSLNKLLNKQLNYRRLETPWRSSDVNALEFIVALTTGLYWWLYWKIWWLADFWPGVWNDLVKWPGRSSSDAGTALHRNAVIGNKKVLSDNIYKYIAFVTGQVSRQAGEHRKHGGWVGGISYNKTDDEVTIGDKVGIITTFGFLCISMA